LTQHNLMDDIRNSKLIAKKLESREYAQQLYAALCNTEWQRTDVWSILSSDGPSTMSWRTAAGLVTDIEPVINGDPRTYIDLYCSGIQEIDNAISEGTITPEIAADLLTIGWIGKNNTNNDLY